MKERGGGEWKRRKSYASIMIFGKKFRLALVLKHGGIKQGNKSMVHIIP